MTTLYFIMPALAHDSGSLIFVGRVEAPSWHFRLDAPITKHHGKSVVVLRGMDL